jgi:ATP-binding cassette subfamily B protein
MNITPRQRLWKLILTEKQEIIPIYFYAMLNGLLQLAVPLGVQAIIGFVIGASMVTSIYVLIIIIVIAVLIVGIMQIKQMQVIEKIQQKIFTRYAFDFAETIPQIDSSIHDKDYLPEKVNRFFDTINVQKGLSKLLLDIPTASIQIILGLLLLALYHPVFIIFGSLLLFILWLILKITGKKGLRTSLKESSYKYAVAGWLQEMAQNIKTFKFSQGTHLNLQKTDTNLLGYLSSRTSHFNVLLFQYWSLVIFKVAITLGMLGVGSYLLIEQQLNIGEFIAAELVILTVISAVEKLIINLDSVYDVITGLEKLSIVLETKLEKDGNIPYRKQDSGMDIRFNHFSFRYPEESPLFKDVNLSVPANSIVCISGETGSGKSTLLRLLGAFYSDFEGSILFNQIPIGQYSLLTLRQNTGVFLHQQELFKGSILENIALGRTEVTYQKVIDYIHELGFGSYFSTFKESLETQVHQSGMNLPYTLQKIILLLRTLVNEPSLLLLEEPWQGMDEKTRKSMEAHLFHKRQNATIFVASNDPGFAQQCDYVITINNGTLSITKNNV